MLKRIDHVAIIVHSIEQALIFYRDILGMIPSEIKDVPTEQVRVVFLHMDGPDGSKVELIEPIMLDSSLARFLEKRGEGLHHICLEVEDVDAALLEMQEKHVLVIDHRQQGTGGRAIFLHPKGTNGVLLELIEKKTCKSTNTLLA